MEGTKTKFYLTPSFSNPKNFDLIVCKYRDGNTGADLNNISMPTICKFLTHFRCHKFINLLDIR